jgi:hypothetical protein
MSLLRRNGRLVLALVAALTFVALGATSAQIPGLRVGTQVGEVAPPDPPPDNPPDTTGPTVTITTPSTASFDNGSSTSMVVSGTWTDASGQLFATDPVTWDNDADMAAAVACTPGVGTFYSCDITGMVDGASNDITVTVKDVFGNSGSDSVTVTVTIPMGGSCMAGAGACVDNVDDITPAVDQTLTASGQDLHQRTTTGWDSFFTANLNRHSFEAANGSDLTVLGYPPGTGIGHTVSNTVAVIGNTSAFFRSTASLPIPPPCGTTGQGIAQSYTYANLGNDLDFWWREYMYWTAPGGWPNNYQKHLELPSAQFMWQPYLQGQGGLAPSQFYAQQAGGSGRVTIDAGARLQTGRWYFVEAHVVREPDALELYVDGRLLASSPVGPIGNASNSANFIGLVNACGTAAWDVNLYMDSFVRGQNRLYADAEIWLCDGSGDDPRTNPQTAGCVWQVPVSISDTSIIFTFRKTQAGLTVPSGTGYIIIVNNARELSNATSVTVP